MDLQITPIQWPLSAAAVQHLTVLLMLTIGAEMAMEQVYQELTRKALQTTKATGRAGLNVELPVL
jgi:hypothetical protein